MTSNKPKVTLVPIEQHFDDDGEPTCNGCVARYADYGDWATRPQEKCPFTVWDADPSDEDCPVHNPTKEAL